MIQYTHCPQGTPSAVQGSIQLLRIGPFTFYRRREKISESADEDEYNDDFNDEASTVDEEPYDDYGRDAPSYVDDDDEYDF